MGFYIRKSVSFGSIRFNLSKSGVGISTGFKGFRIGYGPRGNYIHMGAGGLYYRTTLSAPREPIKKNKPEYTGNENSHATESPVMHEIESIESYKIVDSSSENLVKEMNEKRKKIRFWPFFTAICIWSLYIGAYGIISAFLFVLAVCAVIFDHIRKTTVLMYDLEPEAEKLFHELHNSFEAMAKCSAAWHISSQGNITDWKRNAGAGKLLDRKKISLSSNNPPYVKSNISTPSIPVGKQTLYFFPDKVIVYEANAVGAVSYENLNIEFRESQFIEEQGVPHDSKVVGKTWRFVNKQGGPDRRFNNNKEIPIALYEEVNFTSVTGLNERIQLSKTGVTQKFKENIYGLVRSLASNP